jgi:hypothetical protein
MAAGNHIDIRPGDKVIRFCRDKHRAAQFFIVTDLADDPRTSLANSAFRVFIFSPGASMVMTAILSGRTSSVNADTVSIIRPPEPSLNPTTRRAGGDQTKSAAAPQFMQRLGNHPRAGGGKG